MQGYLALTSCLWYQLKQLYKHIYFKETLSSCLKAVFGKAHRIQETDLSSQTHFKLVCRRTGSKTQGGGMGGSVSPPADTHNYYLPLQAKNVCQSQHMATAAAIKQTGRSQLKTYAFVLSMFCKISTFPLLLRTKVFLQWCIKRITVLVSKFVPLLEDFHCKQAGFIRNCIFFVITSLANFTKITK